MFRVLVAIVLHCVTSAALAESQRNEHVFMQCAVTGREGQVTVSFDDWAAIYRFGQDGKPPELELVQPFAAMRGYRPSGHDIREISEAVAFENDGYVYDVAMGVYDQWIEPGDWDKDRFGKIFRKQNGDEEFGGVTVTKGGTVLAAYPCQPDTITWDRNALFGALVAAGYTWGKIDSRAPVWYDQNSAGDVYPYSRLPTTIPPFVCPYQHVREIDFRYHGAADRLLIDIMGDDCDTADIALTITSNDGRIVHNSRARALRYTYEYQGADGVRAMLMQFLQGYPKSGWDIPEGDIIQSAADDAALLARVKQFDLPLFCHQAGKSFGACFVYVDGRSKLLFTIGT